MAKDQNPSEGPLSGESQEAAPAQEGRPTAEEYKSSGSTVVRTVPGHRVVPTDESLPIVDEHGVTMSATNAKAVVDEFPEWAYIDEAEEGE